MNQLELSDLIYNSCYCEENIWKMMEFVETSKKIDLDKFYVVFISNKNKTVPIWCQKKCKSIEEPVIWDYHVIAIEKDTTNKKSAVYDMDTVLGFPELFTSYTKKSLPQLTNIRDIYKRLYKVIPAKYYLEHFASDRSHMIDTKTGEYFVAPPSYQCIKTNESTNNIDEFISMEHESNKHGEIMNENSFRQFFTAF